MKTQITIDVELDEKKVPETITWNAPDGGLENQSTNALFLSVWDDKTKEALRIDLWNKEMTVDDMKRYFHQMFHSMAHTYQRATNDEDIAKEIELFAEEFAIKSGIKM